MASTISNEVTIYMPSLGGGGAEKSVIRLIGGFTKRGIKVTLVLATPHGNLHYEIPSQVNIITFNSNRSIYSVFKFARYIKKNNPQIIISFLSRGNRNALLAKLLTMNNTRLYVVEQNTISMGLKNSSFINRYLSLLSFKFLYYYADKIINVSKSASDDLSKLLPKNNNSVITIHNPIVDKSMISEEKDEPPHKWLKSKDIPVILGVGRFMEQKDFINLIRAFVLVKKHRSARLIILGEGEQRKIIEEEIRKHNLEDSVDLPGFVRDPFKYMRNASLFALSSKWEGLPTVLVEALACGCPVVSTNCPSGPMEILENGKYGELVPIQNSPALADAIIKTLSDPPSKELLRKRAMEFSIENSVDKYIKLLEI